MKLSLNWIREWTEFEYTPEETAEILTSLGLEVEGWEAVKPSAADLDKVFTAYVASCQPIPDTDHLSATEVETGDGIRRSVVCGAPNVAAGQKVLLAVPGARVFGKDGALFAIGERKVRGVLSQGMICAQDELGLGHDHSGIMVLPSDTPLGLSAAEYFGLSAEIVFDIGLTPNRADATGHIGVAKDLLAWLRIHRNSDASLRMPALWHDPTPLPPCPVRITLADPKACARYCGAVIRGLKVAESPEWLQKRLLALGQRPINNVVDITNYVRMELGQPLHAFDLARIGGGGITVRTLPEGTPFVTLDETERKLHADDLMICDALDTPLCMAGVMGGADSGVTESTSDIFLESAWFEPRGVRRTMLRHGLRTDSAFIFEKGTDPDLAPVALRRAIRLILDLCGGEVVGMPADVYPQPIQPARIPMRYARINSLIGVPLSREETLRIARALEIGIEDEREEGFTAVVAPNKPDVLREADVIEEIVRVFGLDNIPLPAHIRSSMEISPKPDAEAIQNLIAESLVAQGFHECMSLSLNNVAWYVGDRALLPIDEARLARVHNTANQGLDCLRPTLLFGLLEALRLNQTRYTGARLFEFGKVYAAERREGVWTPLESRRLAIAISGQAIQETWMGKEQGARELTFFDLKSVVNRLFERIGIKGYQCSETEQEPFAYALRYHRGAQNLATFGAISPRISRKADLKRTVFYADFDMDALLAAVATTKIVFADFSRFPVVRRDLALVLDQAVTFSQIEQLAFKTIKNGRLKRVGLFDVFEDAERIGAGKKSYALNFFFESPEKTFEDKEINALMTQLQTAFENKLQARVRQ